MSDTARIDDHIEVVDDPGRLTAALELVDEPVVGVDVERADANRYFRRASLVQVGVAGTCLLVDTEAMPTLPALDRFLRDRVCVLHAVDNDVTPLAAAGVELRAPQVADTAIAAAILGMPTGLSSLLEDLLGVALHGDKEAFQRADWSARPLTDGMVAYAAGDVLDLPALWERMAAQLDESGRRGWYEQELTATLERAEEDARDWERVKGSGRLSAEQRATLHGVWDAREEIARREDLAPNRLLRDEVLLTLAQNPPDGPEGLVRRSQRRRRQLRGYADELFAGLQRGLAADPEPRDSDGRGWTDQDRAAFDAMRKGRARVASDLGMDPGVLCPSRSLAAAVTGDPADGRELCELARLRPWQTELLADVLWEAYTGARPPDGPP